MGFRLEFQKVERFRSSSSSTSSSSHYLSKCLLRGTVVLQVLYGHIHFPNSNDIIFVKDVVLQPRPLLSTKKLLVSIAAGVKLKDLQDWAGHSRFIRVMPNTSSAVGVAASEETVMKEKMWYVISQNEPSLLPISSASKLLTEDCMACVDLLEVMLVEHLQRNIVQQCEYSNVKVTELILPQFVF